MNNIRYSLIESQLIKDYLLSKCSKCSEDNISEIVEEILKLERLAKVGKRVTNEWTGIF